MAQYRQLAVIMFTDIVGYTALMNVDEQKAFELLDRNRKIQEPLIKKYNGKWIKELGDGVLASFNAVTDAISCAIAIQQACNHIKELQLRIGLHLGEVMFDNGDIFGDGVNIASRLQALAPVGGIWISEAVYENIVNKKNIVARLVGEKGLKNVKEPIRVYEVDAQQTSPKQPALFYPILNGHTKEYRDKSVAVLPFVNMSNDAEQEYFSDGIAEEIINSLAHLQDLKVAGRMSSFQFKGTNADLREVGEKLGVSTVMEGSVRKQGDRIRITVQLINVQDGFHLWSEKYDRKIDDIFAIQDEIALAITEKLKVTLLKNDRDKLTKIHTQNTAAYELYLKGRFFLNRRGASIVTAIQYFQKAIDTDHEFAVAYAGYADAHLLLATYGLAPPKLVMERVKQSAEKALQLDPSLCEPYCSLGYYYTAHEWNWQEAKKNFLLSLELNPQYCQAHSWYGWNYLSWVEGKFDEAEKHGKILIEIEPLSSTYYGTYSLILHTAGKLQEALAICQFGIEIDSNAFLCRLNEGRIYMAMQQYEKAIASLDATIAISNKHHFAVNGLIWTYCLMGNMEMATSLMNELKERAKKEYVSCTFTGLSAAYLNHYDEAFDYLEKAYNDREPILLALKYEKWGPPEFRKDRRFQNLLERVGFPTG